MLWSKPQILYDTILDYRIESAVSFVKYWQIKNDRTVSVMRVGHKVCLVTMLSAITQTSILWQHLFLDPLLKDMHTGWYLCLLPRRMVVVIKDGLYVCERLVPENEEQVESTKTYMYRFGYEPDMPVQIHDWRKMSESVTLSTQYKGFILRPYQPGYRQAQDIGLEFFKLLVPHTASVLGATLLSLSLGTLYYGYQNYVHDWNRIHVLQAWPVIRSSKARVGKFLELMGLLQEARAPASLIQSIVMNDNGISIQCDDRFPADKNREVMKQFLKKYYPHAAQVKVGRKKNLELTLLP